MVVLWLLVTSVTWQRMVCDPLRNPNNSLVISDVNEFVQLNSNKKLSPLKLNILDVINNCHQNKSVFNVLNLYNVFDLSSMINNYTNKFEIEKNIQKLRNKIKFDDRITLITANAKRKLLDLSKSELADFPFHRFIDELSVNITSLDLLAVSKRLKSLKNELPRDDYLDDKVYRFEQLAEHVKYIQNECNELKDLTLRVENNLKLNFSSLHEAILQLIDRIEFAQHFLDKHGRELIDKLATKFADVFINKIQKYSDRIIDETNNSIGNCAQISHAYNSTLVYMCDNIINPVNVLWMSILICLMLFIPTLIVSVKLSTLYQKAEPYPGPLYRGDYSYDNYGEHDINIPLTSAKKRKHRPKKRDTAPTNVYTDEVFNEPVISRSRNQSGPSSSQKQWEEYSSAPPVYQQPEYERPPPYYYPGPGSKK